MENQGKFAFVVLGALILYWDLCSIYGGVLILYTAQVFGPRCSKTVLLSFFLTFQFS